MPLIPSGGSRGGGRPSWAPGCVRAVLSVPLAVRGRAGGGVSFYYRGHRTPDERHPLPEVHRHLVPVVGQRNLEAESLDPRFRDFHQQHRVPEGKDLD